MTGLQAFLWSIGQQESGGNYTDVNKSSGALGKYQVMPANLAVWTKAAVGKVLTPAEYLADPAAQDAVAKTILGGYYHKYGAAGAAAAWYSGNPKLATSTKPQNGGPSVASYVNEVIGRANKALAGKVKVAAAPTSTSTTTASSGTATAQDASLASSIGGALGSLSPIHLLGDFTGGATSSIEKDLSKLVVSATALSAAAALVVIGLIVAVRPDTKGAGQNVAGAAPMPATSSSSSAAASEVPELAAVAV